LAFKTINPHHFLSVLFFKKKDQKNPAVPFVSSTSTPGCLPKHNLCRFEVCEIYDYGHTSLSVNSLGWPIAILSQTVCFGGRQPGRNATKQMPKPNGKISG